MRTTMNLNIQKYNGNSRFRRIIGDLETEGFVEIDSWLTSIVVEKYNGGSMSEYDLDLIYEIATSWDYSAIVERVDRERAEIRVDK